jgi:hypothetical protein
MDGGEITKGETCVLGYGITLHLIIISTIATTDQSKIKGTCIVEEMVFARNKEKIARFFEILESWATYDLGYFSWRLENCGNYDDVLLMALSKNPKWKYWKLVSGLEPPFGLRITNGNDKDDESD